MRINARLSPDLSEKLQHLIKLRGEKISDIIKASLEQYYDACIQEINSAQILEQSGFIGCAESDVVLSENYKRYLGDSLDEKHSHS